jgi:hypothetical protein
MAEKMLKLTLVLVLAITFPVSVRPNEPIFTGGFLVKVVTSSRRATPEAIRIAFGKDGWRLQPLDEGVPNRISRKAVLGGSGHVAGWFLALPPERKQAPGTNTYENQTAGQGWEKAHEEIEKNFISNRRSLGTNLRAVGAEIVSLEPNFSFPIELHPERTPQQAKRSNGGADEAKIEDGPNPAWPSRPFGWHLSDEFSQLARARKEVEERNRNRPRALIAHLDTGYDPKHFSLPRHFLPRLSTSFDPITGKEIADNGIANQSGHGTGTLALLAGKRVSIRNIWDGDLGGAPDEKVFEVRINDTKFLSGVVHFSTASMYRAIQYASDHDADVISISAGGIPSQLWSEAVDKAYENGTAIFAASGDFLTIPVLGIAFTPYHVVYPAAFSRVIPVTCATCEYGSYGLRGTWAALLPWNWGAAILRGNYGPSYEMRHAIAAYTPNVPWAIYEMTAPLQPRAYHKLPDTHGGFSLAGGGTSASTPQVAAAAALWIAYYHDKLPAHKTAEAWKRAEAVYEALEKNSTQGHHSWIYRKIFLGAGLLRAADALKMSFPEKLIKRAPAAPAWTWISALNPLPLRRGPGTTGTSNHQTDSVTRNMYALEASQLIARSDKLRDMLDKAGTRPDSVNIDPKTRALVVKELRQNPDCSPQLRAFLTAASQNSS